MKNKAVKVLLDVVTYVFIVLCIVCVVFTITAKKSDGAINVFGYQARIVVSESMEKCSETNTDDFDIKDIPLKSLVFIDLVPTDDAEAKEWYADLEVGDVVTFKYKYDRHEVITHRIVEKIENLDKDGNPTGWFTFSMRGDNKALSSDPNASQADLGTQTIDTEVESVNYIIGKVTGQSKVLGFVLYALKQPIVIALVVIVPSLIIMTFEIIKVVGVFSENKKKKQDAEKEKQQNEIEELKKQLAALQMNIQGAKAEENVEATLETKVEENAEENIEESVENKQE